MANVVTVPPGEAAIAGVPHDDRTPGGLPLPHFGNSVVRDIDRLRAALILVDGLLDGVGAAGSVRAMIESAIEALKGAAPASYDTLVEIAAKLEDNDDAVSALVAAIATKAAQTSLDATNANLTAAANAITAINARLNAQRRINATSYYLGSL